MEMKSLLPKGAEPALAERDPFAILRRVMETPFDRLFSELVDPSRALKSFSPHVDVTETDKEVRITAEIPGAEDKDVEVSLSGDAITIKGEKREEKEDKGEERYRVERSYGAFRRSFSLPSGIDADKATAAFKNGVLTVTLPKTAQAATSKKIAVKAA